MAAIPMRVLAAILLLLALSTSARASSEQTDTVSHWIRVCSDPAGAKPCDERLLRISASSKACPPADADIDWLKLFIVHRMSAYPLFGSKPFDEVVAILMRSAWPCGASARTSELRTRQTQ